MARASSKRFGTANVAEALPERVSLALFLGGPFVGQGGREGKGLTTTLDQLKALSGAPGNLGMLFGPLGHLGYDPVRPGAIGLAKGPGTALFHAGRAVGLAAGVQSPKKWRDALRGSAKGPIRPLDVKGAAEAGLAELEDNWTIAYACKPPWIYALVGVDRQTDTAGVLQDLVAVSPRASLGACKAFRQAAGAQGLRSDLVLWMGPDARGMLSPYSAGDTDGMESFSAFPPGAGDFLGSVVDFRGMALGLSIDGGHLSLEGLICADGTLLEGLDEMARRGSRCAIGPRALRGRCPVWALSILDWGILTRLFPPLAGALKRINRKWGNLLQFRSTDERANGMVALGVCGLRPFPRMEEAVAAAQVLSCVDAFLVMELLGQALPFRLAGRVLDSFGDVVRGGLKRLRGSDEEQVASITVAGHRFFLALRRGAMILATSRHALMEARDMMELGVPESIPPGLLLRSECDARRFGTRPARRDPEGLLEEMLQLGAIEWEVRRVPAGLRLGILRKGEGTIADWFD